MSVIAFIPARGGSKSIPLKNIKEFAGKPLIYWVISALQKSSVIDKIVVATDDIMISDTVEALNFDKLSIYHRKQENAADNSSTESVMLEYIKEKSLSKADTFFLVQLTNPFISSQDINDAFDLYKSGTYDSLLTCARIKRFFWEENGTPINYDYNNRPLRQDFKGQFVENGAFYINSVDNIIKSQNRLSGRIAIYEMPEYTYVEMDEEYDWIMGEKIMYKYFIKRSKNQVLPKVLLTDVDGVLTNAGMYYSENGDEQKKFNTRDGKGFELLRNAGVKIGIITAENTKIVERRAQKLKMDYLFQGVQNKLEVVNSICKEKNITLNEIAYVGDDINDMEVLKNVGFPACPNNAEKQIKDIPNILILSKAGGDGAVREFINILLAV